MADRVDAVLTNTSHYAVVCRKEIHLSGFKVLQNCREKMLKSIANYRENGYAGKPVPER